MYESMNDNQWHSVLQTETKPGFCNRQREILNFCGQIMYYDVQSEW